MKNLDNRFFDNVGNKNFELMNIELEHKKIFDNFFQKYTQNLCDFNFNNLFLWKDYFEYKWFLYNERLIILNFNTGFILEPIGEFFCFEELIRLLKNINENINKSINKNTNLNINTNINENINKNINKNIKSGINDEINTKEVKILNNNFFYGYVFYSEKYLNIKEKFVENGFIIEEDRDSANYIYETVKLSTLSGRKFHNKKNLVNQFIKNYKNFKLNNYLSKDVNCDIFKRCFELSAKWSENKIRDFNAIKEHDKEINLIKKEFDILSKICEYFNKLDLILFTLEIDNKIVAFSICSVQNKDMINVHFEKYDINYVGSAQMINYLTANYFKDKYKFINREDDMGLENLRKAKLSYNPDILLIPYKFYKKETF